MTDLPDDLPWQLPYARTEDVRAVWPAVVPGALLAAIVPCPDSDGAPAQLLVLRPEARTALERQRDALSNVGHLVKRRRPHAVRMATDRAIRNQMRRRGWRLSVHQISQLDVFDQLACRKPSGN